MDPVTTATPAQTPTPEQATSTTPPAAPIASNWYDTLPDDLKTDPTVAKYTSLEGATRGLVGAVKLIGERPENLMKRPAAGDDAGTRKVLHQLGLPESPETYTLQPIEGGTPHDTPLATFFRDACYEFGVLPGAMQGVFSKMSTFLAEVEKDQNTAKENHEAAQAKALQEQFGAALDDTVARAEAVADKFGLVKDINDAGLGMHPGLIGALAKLFPMIQEDTAGERPGATTMSSARSPAEYVAEANEITAQALKETTRSRQLELMQKAFRLRQLAAAGK